MAKVAEGRKPDWSVGVMDKSTNARGTVGAGWNNDDGSIHIKLNPCVVLENKPDLIIKLFPVGYTPKPHKKAASKLFSRSEDEAPPYSEDEGAPF